MVPAQWASRVGASRARRTRLHRGRRRERAGSSQDRRGQVVQTTTRAGWVPTRAVWCGASSSFARVGVKLPWSRARFQEADAAGRRASVT
ncbi:hypothetical protein ACFOLD_06965 [Kocuria carniphila]|uniref:hypothetical protein n=1 Tax=Kocuria carniphila TaxID=262208 RepID=UPI00360D12F8